MALRTQAAAAVAVAWVEARLKQAAAEAAPAARRARAAAGLPLREPADAPCPAPVVRPCPAPAVPPRQLDPHRLRRVVPSQQVDRPQLPQAAWSLRAVLLPSAARWETRAAPQAPQARPQKTRVAAARSRVPIPA